jgi:hypothetical protein
MFDLSWWDYLEQWHLHVLGYMSELHDLFAELSGMHADSHWYSIYLYIMPTWLLPCRKWNHLHGLSHYLLNLHHINLSNLLANFLSHQ